MPLRALQRNLMLRERRLRLHARFRRSWMTHMRDAKSAGRAHVHELFWCWGHEVTGAQQPYQERHDRKVEND